MKNRLALIIFALFLLLPLKGRTETLTGVVRNVNYDASRGFGLDVPPLIRVYVNAGTKYAGEDSSQGLRGIKDGDKVEVQGREMQQGTFIATRVTKVGSVGGKVEDLASDAIEIKLGQSFLMGVSQKAKVTKNGKTQLTLFSKEFINTLCDGYNCGGEGEVGMRLEVKGGGDTNEILLTSKNHRKPVNPVVVELHGYEIQLMEAGEDVVLIVVREKS